MDGKELSNFINVVEIGEDSVSSTMYLSKSEPDSSTTIITEDKIESGVIDNCEFLSLEKAFPGDTVSSNTCPIENESEYSSIAILKNISYEVQNGSDGVSENEIHRIITVDESDNTFTISSQTFKNESEKSMIIINFSKSKVRIEPNPVDADTHVDVISIECDEINSVTIYPSSNESAQQNHIFIVDCSEVNAESNEINSQVFEKLMDKLMDINLSFDKVDHGKITSIGTDLNENTLVKLPNSFEPESSSYDFGIHVCDICCTVFLDLSTLTKHNETHCDDGSKKKNNSKKMPPQKIDDMSPVGDMPYNCDICNRGFFDSLTLARHIETHCDDSKKKNISKETPPQKIDDKSPIGDMPYNCDICNRAFFDSLTLAKHIETHCDDSKKNNISKKPPPQKLYNTSVIGNKLFTCDCCNKSFFNSSNLVRHAETHYDDDSKKNVFMKLPSQKFVNMPPIRNRTHKCEIYNEGYFKSSDLVRHAKTHCYYDSKNHQPHKMSLSRKSGMYEIVKMPYRCGICRKGYFNLLDLDRHVKKHRYHYSRNH